MEQQPCWVIMLEVCFILFQLFQADALKHLSEANNVLENGGESTFYTSKTLNYDVLGDKIG